MELIYLNRINKILRENLVGLIPCSAEEVEKLEKYYQINLPLAYREYLLTMGKYSGKFNVGTDCFYDDLFNLRESAILLLKENNINDSLPNNSFVFVCIEGINSCFSN